MKNRKSKTRTRKGEKKTPRYSFVEWMNAGIGIIGIVLGCIAVVPIIMNFIQSPKLEFVRRDIYKNNQQIIARNTIANIGNAIATDIYLELQLTEGDEVVLPFGVAHEIKHDGVDWVVNIKYLSPGESTELTTMSRNVELFEQAAQALKTLPGFYSNVTSIDYKEGDFKDVVFTDSPDLKAKRAKYEQSYHWQNDAVSN